MEERPSPAEARRLSEARRLIELEVDRVVQAMEDF
jgi:hypothetical protein